MTITLCIGKYAGLQAINSGGSLRLCLGWVAFTL